VDVRLRPLREDEFARFLAAQRREYVRSLVEEAGMTHADAAAKADADHASLFPDGAAQLEHRIAQLEDERGDRVGHEADARAAGLRGIDLNVWGRNEIARRLYRSAGFDERAVFMSKELG
jgi:hypothetical protein